jgi:hypothetical protein
MQFYPALRDSVVLHLLLRASTYQNDTALKRDTTLEITTITPILYIYCYVADIIYRFITNKISRDSII